MESPRFVPVDEFCAAHRLSRDVVDEAIGRGLVPVEEIVVQLVAVEEVDDDLLEALAELSDESAEYDCDEETDDDGE